MIEINGKVYRNMPEQVEENMDDINTLVKQLPYNGPYNTLDDIPEDVIVDNGTYLIGTESYTIYKYDKNNDNFVSLGLFGAKGDKGETGAKGETGDRGEQGIKGATGTAAGFGTPVTNVTTVTPVEPATCTVTASGDDTAKVFTFDFEIPQGLQGEKGDKGDKGDTGADGEKGDTGDPVTITLDGVVYESEDGNITLPDYPNTAIWGNVTGDIDDQSDLMAEFAKKQDVISDLGSIRAGALDGASALQSNDVATVALTGSYNDLTNKPNIPTDTSDLTNGAGYITGITSTMINTALGYTAADANDIPTTATSTTTLTPTTSTLVFTKADLTQESVDIITAITASTTTTLS